MLYQEVSTYICPNADPELVWTLNDLANDDHLITQICSANLKGCLSGTFSLKNELIGLANVIQAKDKSVCNMAYDDQSEIKYNLLNYLGKN